jgi:hypothetical protein
VEGGLRTPSDLPRGQHEDNNQKIEQLLPDLKDRADLYLAATLRAGPRLLLRRLARYPAVIRDASVSSTVAQRLPEP